MKKVLVLSTAILMATTCFAVDGVVLINQATVMAAGGFPYKITQPGSYRLSGNLTINTTPNGNFVTETALSEDVAVLVASSNVTLDLNGFNINVVNDIPNLDHNFFAVSATPVTGITVRNGTIALTGSGTVECFLFCSPANPTLASFSGIALFSLRSKVEDITVITGGRGQTFTGSAAAGIGVGENSLVRHVILDSDVPLSVQCPSVVVENVGIGTSPGASCTAYGNSL